MRLRDQAAEYLADGLRETGIVDPQEKTVTVLVRDGDACVAGLPR